MKKVRLLGLLVFLLFLFPMPGTPGADISGGPQASGDQVSRPYELSEVGGVVTGTGDALSYSMTGEAVNRLDPTFVIDSSTSEIATVTISDGWTGSSLSTTIDTLSMDVDDVRNGDLNLYHDEKFILPGETSYNVDDVAVPDSWTLTKSITGSGSTHPIHGIFELNDYSGSGYSSTMGWRFEAPWSSGQTVNSNDQIYLSQQILVPYRDLYTADISFNYRVTSSSDLADQVVLFTRFNGYETEYHVFESGDTTDTWLSTSIRIPGAQVATISTPDSILLEFGLKSNVDGSQASARNAYVFVDNVALDLNVRPFPEQIDLKVNGTAVVGATLSSIYPYEDDDDTRDAWDYSVSGLDLNGNTFAGTAVPSVGTWGSTGWIDTAISELGIQFPMNIPQGAVITSAYLEVEPASVSATTNMRILVAGFNSSGLPIENFTSGLPHLEDRLSYVPTSFDWIPNAWLSTGGVRIRHRTPDIAPLIQKVVSDSDWNSSNYLGVTLDYMWSSSYQASNRIKGAYGSTYSADELPRLFVEYMIPLPEDTAYFMQYEKDITIQSSQVTADLTDFPVLIDITDTDLKTDVQSDGDDIVFRLGDNALDFEIELFDQGYSPTHAHLVAWVKIPNLSSTSDTAITMAYGNPNAESSSSTAVWDDYATVNHLADEPTGTIFDSTPNNHDGTSYGSQGAEDGVTGLIGNSIDFDDEESDMISIGQVYTDDWDQVTISIWVKMDESHDCRVFSKAHTSDPSTHEITIRIAGQAMTARIMTDGVSGSGASYNGNTTMNLGSWNLLTWTWSSSSGNLLGYMNGTPVIDRAHGGVTIADSNDVFTIGNTDLTTAKYFDGILDEARLTNRVLSQDWITTEFNNQIDPSSFVSVGSERSLQSTWTDESSAHAVISTVSPSPISTDVTLALSIEGGGQSLDESYNPGSTFYARNGTNIVDWTAGVLVSPPADATTMNVEIEYPMTEWKPIAVSNPLGENKTYGTHWDFQGGKVYIYDAAVDYWGVWTLYFESWNYAEDLQLGLNGQTLSSTATFDVSDVAEFEVTSPWIEDAMVGLKLTDPTGATWHTDSATTGTPGTLWHIPSFQYRMQLTVPAAQVDADVNNFPMGVNFADADFQTKVQADGDDFVFVQNGIVLSHEIERFESGTGRLVAWVEANLSSTVSNTIWLYYGNPVVGSTESPGDLWSNNYESVWHLSESVTNEASGAAHYDSTFNNYTGTQNGNGITSGIINSFGAAFDGNDWIVIDSTEELNPSGDVTLSGWFYIGSPFDSSSTTSMMLMEKYLNGDNNFHIALAGTDYLESGVPAGTLVFGFETSQNERFTYTTKNAWASDWYHFVCLLDADTPSNNDIYINGVDNTGGSGGSSSAQNLAFEADWGIGGRYGETAEFPTGEAFLTGEMDEVRIASGERTAGWIAVEYDNIANMGAFITEGGEQSRTSPDHSFTKTIDASAAAGIWTATVHYNDTGTSVTNKTGIYERNFIVKHDTSLTLNYPADAVSDKTAYATAGDPLYIEFDLTDDDNAQSVTGATVKMNWTVTGTPTEITLSDMGDGRYATTVDTDDLVTNQQWRINVWSYHQYYNNATDYFDLDLYHATNMSYVNVDTTPIGFDLTATLVFRDSYSDSPITGATITFENDTAVSHIDVGEGRYDVSMNPSTYGLGDHWFRFKATKAGAYLEDAIVNVTFTIRKHYTTVSVSGDLSTPSGFTTDLSVAIIDTDTGATLINTASVTSWTFNPASYSDTTETPPGDFAVTLNTAAWGVAPETVTLTVTMSGNYENPSSYQFVIDIRKHYTSVAVVGDTITPHGQSTDVTVIITDLDTGTELSSTASVTSWTFDSATETDQTEPSPADFAFTLTTGSWDLGTE
ncbi:MAG: DUF2341 domain-containing protein, partial [Candidatus Thorarchaeota archaeon]